MARSVRDMLKAIVDRMTPEEAARIAGIERQAAVQDAAKAASTKKK